MKLLFKHSFFRFALVGSVGFMVDLLSFVILSIWLPASLARGLSFWLAATSNWWWNKHLTFHSPNKLSASAQLKQWLQFIGSSMLAFLPNWGCYFYLSQLNLPLEHSSLQTLWPYLALIPGVLIGMLINYGLAKCWVFEQASTKTPPQPSLARRP